MNDSGEGPSPLPTADISHILGLIELLKSKGGRSDIYKLAQELSMELGTTLNVIRAAELLGLVQTPGGDVALEKLGEKLTKVKVNEKKSLISKQIEKIPVIREVIVYLQTFDPPEAGRGDMLSFLADKIPNTNAEESFESIVSWGRYGELLGYNGDTNTLYLDKLPSSEA